MSEPRLVIPDELHLYIEEQLARIKQLNLDAAAKTQEIAAGPKLLRLEIWKVVVAGIAAAGIVCGALERLLIPAVLPLFVAGAPRPERLPWLWRS